MNELKGKTILITGAKGSETKFEKILTSLGASVKLLPVIEIKPVKSFNELDVKISELDRYEGIFFTSSNAVKYFFERLHASGSKFSGKIYTVGSKTKASVESFGYKVYFAPQVFSAESLADSIDTKQIEGKRFLLPKGNLSGNVLKNRLGSIAVIDEVIIYETVLPDLNSIQVNEIKNMLNEGRIDCICFFSPSSVENFLKIFPDFNQHEIKIAVIGETTSRSAAGLRLEINIIPAESTAESLAEAIAHYFKKAD